MRYREYKPSNELENLIDSYWLIKDLNQFENQRILPDGCADIIFNLGKANCLIQKETSIKSEYKELEDYKNGGALTLYIQVEGLQKWHETIKDKTNVIKPMHKTFYGANEFAIMDINGFILTFSDILE